MGVSESLRQDVFHLRNWFSEEHRQIIRVAFRMAFTNEICPFLHLRAGWKQVSTAQSFLYVECVCQGVWWKSTSPWKVTYLDDNIMVHFHCPLHVVLLLSSLPSLKARLYWYDPAPDREG